MTIQEVEVTFRDDYTAEIRRRRDNDGKAPGPTQETFKRGQTVKAVAFIDGGLADLEMGDHAYFVVGIPTELMEGL